MTERPGDTAQPAERGRPEDGVEAFHFAAGLFGCLHRAAGDRGVVICPPFGHEYVTLHRAARLLASQLARSGHTTLRFDYAGTGDSSGELAEVRLERWIDDAGAAVDELRRRSGVERVSLVGVRLGGALALEVARRRDDLDALALWDPVIWGRAYLRELRRDTRRMYRVAHVVRRREHASGLELLGFGIGEELAGDLRRLEVDTGAAPSVDRVLLLETEAAASAPLGARLRALGIAVESRCEPAERLWRWSEDITRIQLPHPQVRAVAGWLGGNGA